MDMDLITVRNVAFIGLVAMAWLFIIHKFHVLHLSMGNDGVSIGDGK